MHRRNHRVTAGLLVSLVALVATLVMAATVSAAPKDGPTVGLGVTQQSFSASQDVLVTVTLTNPTKHTVRVLRWLTPAEGVEEPLFRVTRDGVPVAYVGPHAKRLPATGSDYVQLKAGASLSAVVDLGASYDLSQSGRYEIAYDVAAFDLFDEKGSGTGRKDILASAKVGIDVTGRAGKGKPSGPPPPPTGGQNFNACTAEQQAQLVAARAAAKTYAGGAVSYLAKNDNQLGPRYTTWFGVVTTARHTTTSSNFAAISNAMSNAGITFDCSSKQKVYAYVFSNRPYTIYLGKVYWTAPPTGTDSQAGTLIHEMSHFDVVAGTDDVVYGQTGAQSLALSAPDDAIRNADSHEYFAENTPALP